MSINPDIRDQAYRFFIEEAQELLEIIETGLLNLNEQQDVGTVHQLMRAAHSIKGGAASVGLEAIKTISHRLEDIFKALYSDTVVFDTELESLLLAGFDCLKEPLQQQIDQGHFDAAAAIAAANSVFEQLEDRLKDALRQTDSYIPSANDLGVDIVASIFELDVQEGLNQLESAIATGQNETVAAEITRLVDIFNGFAELFNLAGFGAIAQTAQAALVQNPQAAIAIGQCFKDDCVKAREQVLSGDRSSGGGPSPELIYLSQSELESIEGLPANSEPQFSNETEEDWASASFSDRDDHLLEDFEPTPEITSEIFEELATTAQTSNAEPLPSLDALFGGELEPLVTEEEIKEVESQPASLDNDLYGNLEPLVTEEETKEVESQPASLNDDLYGNLEPLVIEEEIKEVESPSLEDLFGNLETTAIEETEVKLEPPSLDEVFGQAELTADELSPLYVDADVVESADDAPDLNQVFSDDINLTETELIASESDELAASSTLDLSTEIELITAEFNNLPVAESTSLTPPHLNPRSKPKALPPSKNNLVESVVDQNSTRKASKNKATAANLTIRVDLNRLEKMNNLIGELVINRNSLALQNEQLQATVRDLTQKFTRFRQLTHQVRDISDRMLVETTSLRQNQLAWAKRLPHQNSDFDALEMDSYSQINLLLQGVLEEMMQLEESVEDVSFFARGSNQSIEQQRQMLNQMRNELMWARMLPLSQIIQRFPRVLRDLSTTYKKPVNLKLIGTSVLVDKAILEKLYDPLLHLLRNGFDHGIESAEIRMQQGKPKEGQIEIEAYYQGNQTIIEIRDDGKGLDLEKIARKAIQKGIIHQQQLASITQAELLNLIFEPGFSTAAKVNELSGRGVGLNVVRSQIQSLKGKVEVNSNPGRGTTFILRLPLTLTIAKILVCQSDTTPLAFASDSIEEIIIPEAQQTSISGKQRFLHWQDQMIPVYPVTQMLQYNCSMPVNTYNRVQTVPTPEDWASPLLLIRQGNNLFALEIERLITEEELVIKPFGSAIAAPNYTYGCTIMGDGSLIPVINAPVLIDHYLSSSDPQKNSTATMSESELENLLQLDDFERERDAASLNSTSAVSYKTILAVDDSTALRRTLALSLEKQGYRVLQAQDGRQALEQLKKNRDIDLVICDVEMPQMNGFEFLGMRRRDPELTKIPVAMLTSRSNDRHRLLAQQLGAIAYFTKPYIEQEFISAIKQIITEHQC